MMEDSPQTVRRAGITQVCSKSVLRVSATAGSQYTGRIIETGSWTRPYLDSPSKLYPELAAGCTVSIYHNLGESLLLLEHGKMA